MTSLRLRILAFMILVFLAVPAFAQESTAQTLAPTASIGCLGIGLVALMAVGALAAARERKIQTDPTLEIKPNETPTNELPDDQTFVAPSA